MKVSIVINQVNTNSKIIRTLSFNYKKKKKLQQLFCSVRISVQPEMKQQQIKN